MRIKLIAVGTKMPKWVEQGYEEYAKRLPREFSLELMEIAPGNRGKNADIERAIRKEGELMMSKISSSDHVVALEVLGKTWSTEQLAKEAEGWQMLGRDVCLLVGGPEGLAQECKQRANQQWSLSPLTLPHPMVRLLLAEQVYRAWSVIQGHPYHR
ncbi:23S rRNA (pseudouridine(1915)-N(3))-methyltransferase RlmH [Oceanospirillum linum]|uniref:Ribosomal RNA large subunit methyltransferase H n=1 Tax=Oceanospirillum linum TaxID=966 RepID=A0A1T1H9I3_OCELI|nr:23S rRNA (pseudouridine(1915)-N(3))-methyltransferase RlmH [Oceanospirillum linum]OOV86524.1 23S rRNA (pseudouridine(1915)-N(3))-methyltransferase RlmH [Oceanospirillum linum]SEG35754.1 23S rRNA (pseudouridine1915-N3)-methyltransferase [Oleiphilus messinensis]SMP29947.1 23S rRNA (pseudouridine1915-N3)-methyltransferase [Oceanospirillum linum]